MYWSVSFVLCALIVMYSLTTPVLVWLSPGRPKALGDANVGTKPHATIVINWTICRINIIFKGVRNASSSCSDFNIVTICINTMGDTTPWWQELRSHFYTTKARLYQPADHFKRTALLGGSHYHIIYIDILFVSEFSAMVDQPLQPPSWCTCPGNNDQCLVLPCCPRAVCLLSPHSTVPGHSSSFLGDATHTKCCEKC